MTTFDRCLESLAFCHLQEEHLWAAARVVAQQDIDAFIEEASPDMAGKLEALLRLLSEFDARFAGQTDPVLIRSYMRRHIRRIEYDLKRLENPDNLLNQGDAPATAPEAGEADPGMSEFPDEAVERLEHVPDLRAREDQ